MIGLETIFSSNVPVDCHILKGRLETDGIDCFIFDENIVWVHPFKAVAIGGVKLKVPSDQTKAANRIISSINSAESIDEDGNYNLSNVLNDAIIKQNEILKIKTLIRNNPNLLKNNTDLKSKLLIQSEINSLIDSEKEFHILSNKRLDFTLKQFWYELFDPERSIFKYLRTKPAEFYIEQDIVQNFNSKTDSDSGIICPKCKSRNVSYGYAIDYKWDILYMILSFLFHTPFPLYRKNYHCFNCKFDFKNNKRQQLTANNTP